MSKEADEFMKRKLLREAAVVEVVFSNRKSRMTGLINEIKSKKPDKWEQDGEKGL